MNKKDICNLETKGYTILRNWVSEEWINKFKKNLPEKTVIREEMKKKMKISIILFSFNVY